MKLLTIITTFAALVTPMAVVAQSEEMFNGYPYCTGCETVFEDADGKWNVINDTWCKVNDEKCQEKTCNSVNGFPCCEDSSTNVEYVDFDGEWGVENDIWCFRNPLPSYHGDYIDVQDGRINPDDKSDYIFYLDSYDKKSFLVNYTIKDVTFNDVPVDRYSLFVPEKMTFHTPVENVLTEGFNIIKFILTDKETKVNYIKTSRYRVIH